MKMSLEEKIEHGQYLWDCLMLRDCPQHYFFAKQYAPWQYFEYKPTSEKVLIENTATDEHGNNTCIMLALKKHNPWKTYLKNGSGHKVFGIRAFELVKLEEVDEPMLDRFIEFAEEELEFTGSSTAS